MALSDSEINALNEAHATITEIAQGYNGLAADIPLGDRINDIGVFGTVTLQGTSTSTQVNDSRIQANDKVFLQAQNVSAANLAGVFVDPSNNVPGINFDIDHASAAGSEVFAYQISRV